MIRDDYNGIAWARGWCSRMLGAGEPAGMEARGDLALLFVADFVDAFGFAPATREIGEALGGVCSSQVHRTLVQLARADALDLIRAAGKAGVGISRGLQLTDKGRRMAERIRDRCDTADEYVRAVR